MMTSSPHRFTRAAFTAFTARTDLKTVYNRLGTLKYILEQGPIGVVTSAKHEKRAVVRNRVRRRVYTHLSKNQAPFSGILYTSKQSFQLSAAETFQLLDSLLTNAKKSTQ